MPINHWLGALNYGEAAKRSFLLRIGTIFMKILRIQIT
jgi:hypothetical protein